MGAAEDAANQAHAAEAAPFIAEVGQLLIPQIITMLQARDYNYGPVAGLYSHSFFRINGVERVAWKIWSDEWESGPESYITADGKFILGAVSNCLRSRSSSYIMTHTSSQNSWRTCARWLGARRSAKACLGPP